MTKLTKEQKEEIKKLYLEGKTITELSRMFNVSLLTIRWYVDDSYKDKWKAYHNQYRKKKKVWLNEKQKEYQRKYHKERYNQDPLFRQRHLDLVKLSSSTLE